MRGSPARPVALRANSEGPDPKQSVCVEPASANVHIMDTNTLLKNKKALAQKGVKKKNISKESAKMVQSRSLLLALYSFIPAAVSRSDFLSAALPSALMQVF